MFVKHEEGISSKQKVASVGSTNKVLDEAISGNKVINSDMKMKRERWSEGEVCLPKLLHSSL